MYIPFCPNPRCHYHHHKSKRSEQLFVSHGSYPTRAHGVVPRYRCLCCRRTFSRQTFRIDYYTKRRFSYHAIVQRLAAGESQRAIARALGATHATVRNRIGRKARQDLARMLELLPLATLREPFVADGLESFCYSQDFPTHFTVLAGGKSQLLYGFSYATLRRKGRMTGAQRQRVKRLKELYRMLVKPLSESFGEVCELLVRLAAERSADRLILDTDEHSAYRRALGSHPVLRSWRRCRRFTHRTTSSKQPRTHANRLFAANYLDREMRKDLHEHARETVCFARNAAASAERFIVYAAHHNFEKRFRINQPLADTTTHAQVAGIPAQRIASVSHYYRRMRAFASKVPLWGTFATVWYRRLPTAFKYDAEYLPLHCRAG